MIRHFDASNIISEKHNITLYEKQCSNTSQTGDLAYDVTAVQRGSKTARRHRAKEGVLKCL